MEQNLTNAAGFTVCPSAELDAEREMLLFKPENAAVLKQYITNFQLSGDNHYLLFLPRNRDVLAAYLKKYTLNPDCEEKLFAAGMDDLRRIYMNANSFHSQRAEQKLFYPEFAGDLLIYVKEKHFISAGNERLFFEKGCEAAKDVYLEYHALTEKNQPLLFKDENYGVLKKYVKHWTLRADLEKKLFDDKYRKDLLKTYISEHAFTGSENELLLFAHGMEEYRHLYISLRCFYNREAEARLFRPEYLSDLEIYIRHRQIFFKEHMELLMDKTPEYIRHLYNNCYSGK